MAQRVTQDFVALYELLKARTGNSPSNVRAALGKNGQLAWSIHELDDMWMRIKKHRQFSKSRFIVQAHAKFGEALRDYERRWAPVVEGWLAEAPDKTLTSFLDLLDEPNEEGNLAKKAAKSVDSRPRWDAPDRWEFDPDQDSAADLIAFAAEAVLPFQSESDDLYGSTCSRITGALKWLRETVGIDLAEIERRWKDFPSIVVPQHVSDRHGIEDPRSLFGYLTQIRLAYMVEADLAAIAMCRAATEILMRHHYNQDRKTDLTPLIKLTQTKRDYQWLKIHNLVAMVEKANDILHFSATSDAIKHRDWSRALVRRWVETLQEMILKAPTIPKAS